jgi:hypothetical protein
MLFSRDKYFRLASYAEIFILSRWIVFIFDTGATSQSLIIIMKVDYLSEVAP